MSSTIIPSLRYRDAPAAIEFLCAAFGFSRHLVVPGEEGSIAHAQLTTGTGMVMLGTARDDEFGAMISRPDGGVSTQACYVIVADVDAHHARAAAAGARIFRGPVAEDHGGRGYGARDPEGHVWYFGSYDPWA